MKILHITVFGFGKFIRENRNVYGKVSNAASPAHLTYC